LAKEKIKKNISAKAKLLFAFIPVCFLIMIELSARTYLYYDKTDESKIDHGKYIYFPEADETSNPQKLRANYTYQFKIALPFIPFHMVDKYVYYRPEPEASYTFMLQSGYIVNYSINSLGFRGDEFPLKKEKRTKRILCIGDSSTFGFFLNLDDTYPALLENTLRIGENGSDFQVINAGVMGFSSYQGRRYFETRLRTLQPDIVIFACGFNDSTRWFPDSYFKPESALVIEIKEILGNLASYELADRFIHKIMGRSFGDPDISPRVSFEEYKKNLAKLVGMCEEDDIHLVILPIAFPKSYVPFIEKFAENKKNTGFINLPEIFKSCIKDYVEDDISSYDGISFDSMIKRYFDDNYLAFGKPGEIAFNKVRGAIFMDDCHPTPIGNRVIVKEIIEYLDKNKLLD